METTREANGPDLVPWPSSPAGDFMSESQWEVFYALLDGAMPGFISHTRFQTRSKTHTQTSAGGRIVLPDGEFEEILDQAVQALPKAQAGTETNFVTARDELGQFFEYQPAEDPRIRADSLSVLVRSGQRERLAQVLHLLT